MLLSQNLREKMQFLSLDGEIKWAGPMAEIHQRAFESPWNISDFSGFLQQEYIHCYGVVVCQTLVSFCILSVIEAEAEIYTLVTDSGSLRLGVAERLFRNMLDDLRRKRIQDIFLEVDEENTAAVNFYTKMGFNKISIRKAYYQHSERKSTDAFVMQLSLV